MSKSIDMKLLSDPKPSVRYGYAKSLLEDVKKRPAAFVAETDTVAGLLADERSIIRWIAIDMLGYMGFVSSEKNAVRALELLYPFLRCGKLIDTAHALFALSEIALGHKKFQREITDRLCEAETASYPTEECRQIVIGHALRQLLRHAGKVTFSPAVMEFISRAAFSSRKATARRAETLLKKLS